MALAYFGEQVMIAVALAIGILLAAPKPIVKEWLQVVRDIIQWAFHSEILYPYAAFPRLSCGRRHCPQW